MRALCIASLTLLVAAACHRAPPPADPASAAAGTTVKDALREQALRDLQSDVTTLRVQLGITSALAQAATKSPAPASAALYTCDRVAIATRELADDARAQALLGEADSMCAYHAPLQATEQRLGALEAARTPDTRGAPVDCGPIRDIFARIGAKYRGDAKLATLIERFKADCPKVRLFAAPRSHERSPVASGGAPLPNPGANRDACRKRCEDNAWRCSSSCMYCGSCTTDKTWEWCNATCNNCKQGCEQAKNGCEASCG